MTFRNTFLMLAFLAATPICRGDLIHYYSFTTDASDSVAGGAAGGTLLGGASVSGGVLHLDGIDDYVQMGTHVVPTSGSYTVALFARQIGSQAGSYVELISQGFSQVGPQYGFYIGHDNGATPRIRVTDASLPNTGVLFPTDGEAHHYALVVDATANASRFYLDGSLVWSLGFAITSQAGGNDTRLGRQYSPFGEFFRGTLDELRIYNTALSGDDVARLAAVPEPSSLAIGFGGIVGSLVLGRHRGARRWHSPATDS